MIVEDLLEKLKDYFQTAGEKYGLEFAILYGSYVKGKQKKESDIDVAVLGKKRLSLKDTIEISGELSSILEENNMDVKSLNETDPLFRYQVAKDGILVFGDSHKYAYYRAYAFRDYIDSQSLFRLREILTRKKLGKIS